MATNQEETVKHERIHIDRKPYASPNSTTGAALYALGQVSPGKKLFREVEGDHEDELIPNDGKEIHLKMDEHFYSELEFKIVVNGRQKDITTEDELSYDQVVHLAFDPPPTGPDLIFTITYRNGPPENHEGTMVEGQTVEIREGMIFNATPTNRS